MPSRTTYLFILYQFKRGKEYEEYAYGGNVFQTEDYDFHYVDFYISIVG